MSELGSVSLQLATGVCSSHGAPSPDICSPSKALVPCSVEYDIELGPAVPSHRQVTTKKASPCLSFLHPSVCHFLLVGYMEEEEESSGRHSWVCEKSADFSRLTAQGWVEIKKPLPLPGTTVQDTRRSRAGAREVPP